MACPLRIQRICCNTHSHDDRTCSKTKQSKVSGQAVFGQHLAEIIPHDVHTIIGVGSSATLVAFNTCYLERCLPENL